MSKKRLIDTIENCKIYWDSEFQEYSIKVPDHKEPVYFTDDKKDAISTAKFINKTLDKGIILS